MKGTIKRRKLKEEADIGLKRSLGTLIAILEGTEGDNRGDASQGSQGTGSASRRESCKNLRREKN